MLPLYASVPATFVVPALSVNVMPLVVTGWLKVALGATLMPTPVAWLAGAVDSPQVRPGPPRW